MSEKERLEQQLAICKYVSLGFGILLAAGILAEAALIGLGGDALWVKKLLRLLGAVVLASPFGVLIPLFFRVNIQNKLTLLKRKESQKKAQKRANQEVIEERSGQE